VVSAFSYYDSNDSILLADDRHAILAIVRSEDPDVASGDDIDIQSILVAVNEAGNAADGFEIEIVSTRLIEEQIEVIFEKDFQRVMVISLVFGLGILLLAFRALVAAVIPLVMAIFAIITALGVVAVVSQTYAFAESYREVLILMGLAVGIDYSLFVMSRFLNERAGGRPKLEAIAVASNTTGRAVVYVAGDTADGIDFEKRVSTAAPLVFSFVLGFSFLLLFAHVPFHCHRNQSHHPQPPISSGGVRRTGYGVSVGLGYQHPWLRGDRHHRGMVATVPFRDPLRTFHGLPHAAVEPDQGVP